MPREYVKEFLCTMHSITEDAGAKATVSPLNIIHSKNKKCASSCQPEQYDCCNGSNAPDTKRNAPNRRSMI